MYLKPSPETSLQLKVHQFQELQPTMGPLCQLAQRLINKLTLDPNFLTDTASQFKNIGHSKLNPKQTSVLSVPKT